MGPIWIRLIVIGWWLQPMTGAEGHLAFCFPVFYPPKSSTSTDEEPEDATWA